MSMMFGYLYGSHKSQRAGRLIAESVEELDGRRLLVKRYELVEEEVVTERPWMMETAVGQVHVCVPEALTSEIEKLAPAGFEVVWRAQPIKRRGRRRKTETLEPPTNPTANGKVEGVTSIVIHDEEEDDDSEDEFSLV